MAKADKEHDRKIRKAWANMKDKTKTAMLAGRSWRARTMSHEVGRLKLPYPKTKSRCRANFGDPKKTGTCTYQKKKASSSVPKLTTKSGKPDMRYRVNKLMFP